MKLLLKNGGKRFLQGLPLTGQSVFLNTFSLTQDPKGTNCLDECIVSLFIYLFIKKQKTVCLSIQRRSYLPVPFWQKLMLLSFCDSM